MSKRSSVTLIGLVVLAVLMDDYQKRAQQRVNKIGMPMSFREPATTPSVQNVTIVP